MCSDLESVFGPFRPYCSVLAANPNAKILSELSGLVDRTEPDKLQGMEEYILFPAQVYLKTPTMPENYTIQVLNFVKDFYIKSGLMGSEFIMRDLARNITVSIVSKKASLFLHVILYSTEKVDVDENL